MDTCGECGGPGMDCLGRCGGIDMNSIWPDIWHISGGAGWENFRIRNLVFDNEAYAPKNDTNGVCCPRSIYNTQCDKCGEKQYLGLAADNVDFSQQLTDWKYTQYIPQYIDCKNECDGANMYDTSGLEQPEHCCATGEMDFCGVCGGDDSTCTDSLGTKGCPTNTSWTTFIGSTALQQKYYISTSAPYPYPNAVQTIPSGTFDMASHFTRGDDTLYHNADVCALQDQFGTDCVYGNYHEPLGLCFGHYELAQDNSQTIHIEATTVEQTCTPGDFLTELDAARGRVCAVSKIDDIIQVSTCGDCGCNQHHSADACDVCGGDSSTCLDCAGTPNGNNVYDGTGNQTSEHCCLPEDIDFCQECHGNNLTCSDCNGVVNGHAVRDDCGVCGGDGSSCRYCNIGNWSEWSECSANCGGFQTRNRTMEGPTCHEHELAGTHPFQNRTCFGFNAEYNTAYHDSACGCVPTGSPEAYACVPCTFDPWSEWTTCTGCQKSRFREIDGTELCNNVPELEPCINSPTPSSGSCERETETCNPVFNGTECCNCAGAFDAASCKVFDACGECGGNGYACRVDDCIMGDWTAWGECSWGSAAEGTLNECENGQKTRYQYATQLPRNGGISCNFSTKTYGNGSILELNWIEEHETCAPTKTYDECGVCNGLGIPTDACDCAGTPDYSLAGCECGDAPDDCGVCGGPGFNEYQCCDGKINEGCGCVAPGENASTLTLCTTHPVVFYEDELLYGPSTYDFKGRCVNKADVVWFSNTSYQENILRLEKERCTQSCSYQWTEYSDCDNTCGHGNKVRTANVVRFYNEHFNATNVAECTLLNISAADCAFTGQVVADCALLGEPVQEELGCVGNVIPEGKCDCHGNDNDDCGVCGGDHSSCADCCNVPNGGGTTCDGVCGACNDGTSCLDACGVANGDNSSCVVDTTVEAVEDVTVEDAPSNVTVEAVEDVEDAPSNVTVEAVEDVEDAPSNVTVEAVEDTTVEDAPSNVTHNNSGQTNMSSVWVPLVVFAVLLTVMVSRCARPRKGVEVEEKSALLGSSLHF